MNFETFPTRLSMMAQAMVVRAVRKEAVDQGRPALRGAALVSLRRAVAAGSYDSHPAADAYRSERRRISRLKIEDMPPAPEDVWLLVETISQANGIIGQAGAWAKIGVSENRGREYLTRASGSVDWPVWFALRHTALGK
tara:strand:- start:638 stop:1054 length:417 start_codon:yes stop_codon:yes gene_type:complete